MKNNFPDVLEYSWAFPDEGIISTKDIVIAALRLFGLSSYTTLQRTKEIGIRKFNGASANRILIRPV